MLRLHEDILLEIKTLVPDSHMHFDAAAHQRSNHPRWYSVESTEAASGASLVRKARPANDSSWFGSYRDRSLVTTPAEAADIARVFECMVCDSCHPETAEKLKVNGLCVPAQTLLFIRGVWRQVRVYVTKYGDALEDHTKLVHV